jgi:hypothetical protein
MAEPTELILEHLRAIRTDIAEIKQDVKGLKVRMSAMEMGLVGLRKEISLIHETQAHQWTVLDQYDERLKRLEARDGLISDPTAGAH